MGETCSCANKENENEQSNVSQDQILQIRAQANKNNGSGLKGEDNYASNVSLSKLDQKQMLELMNGNTYEGQLSEGKR